jgi:hypothetical protein
MLLLLRLRELDFRRQAHWKKYFADVVPLVGQLRKF